MSTVQPTCLWCLCRADHAPVSVVELARPGQLPIPSDGRVESPEVGQRGGKCEPVQYLVEGEERGERKGRETGVRGRRKGMLGHMVDKD